MAAIVLFFLLLSSGSVFFAAFRQKKFEELIPITAISAVLIVFIFGIMGHLTVGVDACIAIAAALYILTAVKLLREKNYREFANNLVTPGFVVFLVAGVVFTIGDVGKMPDIIDDFSHWADIVKVMTYLGDFGTHPESQSMFASYLPGVSIFQYILQRLGCLAAGQVQFTEWYLSFAFQMFIVIILLPFLSKTSFQNLFEIFLLCVTLFIGTLFIGRYMYRDICIDPFVGLLSGAGLSMILLCDRKDGFYHAAIWLLSAMLILAKDIGIMFAIILVLAYTADVFFGTNQRTLMQKFRLSAMCLMFAVVPKLLWANEVKMSGVKNRAATGFDVGALIQILLGNDTSYRSRVIPNYIAQMGIEGPFLGHIPVMVPFVLVIAIFLTAYVLLYKVYRKKEPEKSRARAMVLSLSAAQMVLYAVGLPILYMFHFSEYEANELMCMERYLKMELISNWLVILTMAVFAVIRWSSNKKVWIAFLLAILVISPAKETYNVLFRIHVRNSVAYRSHLEPMRELTENYCTGEDRIFLVNQKETDIDNMVIKYNCRPSAYGHLGFLAAREEEGIKRAIYSLEELRQVILEKYDYVLLYKLDEIFLESYTGLFDNPEEIAEEALYKVNQQTGLLERCP